MQRLVALTFDLDTIARDLYRPALNAADVRRLEDISFNAVVPRIAEWLTRIKVRATFFVIGEYARRYAGVIRELARTGHEIASHTFSHPRNFSELGRADILRDLKHAHETLTAAAGIEPIGFRAPGFTTSPALIEALGELDYTYDSSIVPSWAYTTLKHVYRAARLASTGYLYPESYRCALSPQLPYRIAPERRFEASADAPLLEIPITTMSLLQWPMIHGLHGRGRGQWRQWIERRALAKPFVLMVFHDLEFAVPTDLGGLPIGTLTAPHVRLPIEDRFARIEQWIMRASNSHVFTPLREVAERYAPDCVRIPR
jgi:peptidoglycan/xylan/chitin deacetylase (PgdA/CDA1 family)